MPDEESQVAAILHETMLLYIERLRHPDVVTATDARGAASVLKMLLEKLSGEGPSEDDIDREERAGEMLSRREILELLHRIARDREADTEK